MSGILAIETSSDACSIAILRDGALRERHVVEPRRHNQLIFALLRELVEPHELVPAHSSAIAYGAGPGSFTGLRIAASAAQGICFAAQLPALPVSTLAAQVQSAIRLGLAGEGSWVLSTLDAHIGELYWALYQVVDGRPHAVASEAACRPEALVIPGAEQVVALGGGMRYLADMTAASQARFSAVHDTLLPSAEDVLPFAEAAFTAGVWQQAEAICPVYVRDEIRWKKLAEQGPQS